MASEVSVERAHRFFCVNTHEELFYHQGHQFSVDEWGHLHIYDYKEIRDRVLPQLTTVATYAANFWLSIAEVDKNVYDENTSSA